MNMKKLFLLLALSAVLFSSCTTFRFSGAQVSKNLPRFDVLGEFEVEVKVLELLGAPGGANFGNLSATKMDDAIYDAVQEEIASRNGDAAIDLTIEYKAQPADILLATITGNIISPATAFVSGTVISFK